MEYVDFDIEIGQGSGREYPVRAVGVRDTMSFPFDELALDNRLKDIQIALLRSGSTHRLAPSPEDQAVQDFGRALFDALFTDDLRSIYDRTRFEARSQNRGVRLRLHILSPQLAALPWEFLYDPRQNEFVCLSRNTPVVRYLEAAHSLEPLAVKAPLRILGMIASPQGLPQLDVAREKQRMEEALKNLQTAGLVELKWLEGQTWRDLQRAMRGGPWHVFHFVGHGAFDRNADEGIIMLADEYGDPNRMEATELAVLLADHNSLRLTVLNACEGGRSGGRDIFSSSASILVSRGIPAVVAMQYPITDRAAIEFARSFYEAVADDVSVDAATVEARKAIRVAMPNTFEWGTPVLYMRSASGVLFNVKREPATVVAKRPEPQNIPPVSAPIPTPGPERVEQKPAAVEPARVEPEPVKIESRVAPQPQPVVAPAIEQPRRSWTWPVMIGGLVLACLLCVGVIVGGSFLQGLFVAATQTAPQTAPVPAPTTRALAPTEPAVITVAPEPTTAVPIPTTAVPVIATTAAPIVIIAPDQAVRDYYGFINNKQYDKAWAMLSERFRVDFNGPECGGNIAYDQCKPYTSWWVDQNVVTEILETRVEDATGTSALVYARLRYYPKSGGAVDDVRPYIKLIPNSTGTGWLFDAKSDKPIP
jgi:hypothetical protein